MKEKVFFLFLFFIPVINYAQSSANAEMAGMPRRTFQLKMYNLVSASRANEAYVANNTSHTQVSSFHIWNPTIAIARENKKRNLHEFELTSIGINASDMRTNWFVPGLNVNVITSGARVYETHIALRYEHILNLVKKPGARLVPSIGFSASPYYLRYNVQPYVTTTYPTKETFIGARVFVAPRINYYIHKAVFIDLNIPVCLADINYNKHREDNPTVSTQQRSTSKTNFTALPEYFSVRLGIGVRL